MKKVLKNKTTKGMKTKKVTKNIDLLVVPILKFIFLLDNSGMPKEIKEAWASLIPKMSLEQIDKLMQVLEARYLNQQTKDIDTKYQQDFKKLVEKYQQEDDDNRKKLIKQLKELENF